MISGKVVVNMKTAPGGSLPEREFRENAAFFERCPYGVLTEAEIYIEATDEEMYELALEEAFERLRCEALQRMLEAMEEEREPTPATPFSWSQLHDEPTPAH